MTAGEGTDHGGPRSTVGGRLIELCLYYDHQHEAETWEEIDRMIESCRARHRQETGMDGPVGVAPPVYEGPRTIWGVEITP